MADVIYVCGNVTCCGIWCPHSCVAEASGTVTSYMSRSSTDSDLRWQWIWPGFGWDVHSSSVTKQTQIHFPACAPAATNPLMVFPSRNVSFRICQKLRKQIRRDLTSPWIANLTNECETDGMIGRKKTITLFFWKSCFQGKDKISSETVNCFL